MVAPALKQVGVEAVVEGLGKFISDVGTMNKSIGSIGDQGNLLTRALGGVRDAFGWLGDKIVDVATYALGQLLASAIEAILSKIGDLIASVVQAGAEFQILELRLTRLNFNDAFESTGDFSTAMGIATEATKEQLSWLQRLAVQTPYDAQDIANVFTLARSYGFASDSAKGLTEDITDFAAGMGLGSTEIERIIVNFGQMVQQGKVTQREMNDLARGSFVPVNDVLARMQENVGMTDAAFKDFRGTAEGVQEFFKAFSQIVETRFAGAAQTMARTFQGATANAQDFLKSLFGFNIVRPILDQLGGNLADVINSLTAEGNWDRLNAAAARVGEQFRSLLNVFSEIFKLDTSSFADTLIGALNGIADWMFENRGEIWNFFLGIRDTIRDKVIPFLTQTLPQALNKFINWFAEHRGPIVAFFELILRNARRVGEWISRNVVTAFNQISDWVSKNKGLIGTFFETLGQIISTVFYDLTHIDLSGGGLQGFLEGIGKFMQMVIDNKEGIADFVELLIKLWAVFQVISAVVSFLVGVFVAVLTTVIALGAAVASAVAVFALLTNPVGLLIVAFVALGATIAVFWQDAVVGFQYLGSVIATWWANVVAGFQYVGAVMAEWWAAAGAGFQYVEEVITTWASNAATTLVNFVTNGLQMIGEFVSGAVEKFLDLKDQFNVLIQAIIKRVKDAPWGTLGRDIIHGMATGVVHAMQGLIDAVVTAVKAAIEAARATLKAFSPSRVFMDIGEGTMEGMAIGIKRMAGLAERTMQTAIGDIAMPAVMQQYSLAPSTVNNNNSYTNYWNLSINSRAKTESIVQDFNMMQSLSGG